MKNVRLYLLNGYAMEETAWKVLSDVSAELVQIHSKGCSYGHVGGNEIFLDENGVWHLAENENPVHKSSASDIWDLGATVFYLLMGVPVFGGRGEECQTEKMPVPTFRKDRFNHLLGELVGNCLQCNPEKRPDAKTVHDIAIEGLKKCRSELKGRTLRESVQDRKEEVLKFWPDKMIMVIVFFFMTIMVSAQNYTEQMERLVSYATELRTSGSDESVYRKLVADNCWTLMNEVEQVEGECSRSARIKMDKTGINDLAYRAESENRGKYASAGNFCNGNDPRYNYSFIEKTIMAGKTVSYNITGRVGHQTFVIVPFSDDYSIQASASVNDNESVGFRDGNGNVVIEVDADDNIVLSLTNGSGKDISYVLINYNSRSEK